MLLDQLLERIGDSADFAGIRIADANTRGLFGNYPLHVAAVWGDCDAIRTLVEAQARIDQPGEHGFAPLMEAVAQGRAEAALLLIDLGASALRNDDGQLPSDYAALMGSAELAASLARRGF